MTQLITKRRILFSVLILGLITVIVGIYIATQVRDLRSRLALISVGMPRAEVERILGRPVLVLGRSSRPGHALVWVDQLWQAEVITDGQERVERIGCVPSNSMLRRSLGRLIKLP